MDLEKAFLEIEKLLTEKQLISHGELFNVAEAVSDCLEGEVTSYREAASDGSAGSFIDFRESELPVIVVPDLHARPYFLLNILKHSFYEGKTVFQCLAEKSIILVFVGDILHSERNTRERWIAAQEEFNQGIYTGPAISSEMAEALSLMSGLFRLKTLFPENCHILKGNHENILNVTEGGDYGFRKYVDEGNMCRIFLQEYYGDDIVYIIHCVERVLPLAFAGNTCVVSHAEPKSAFSLQELIDARLFPKVVEGLTWTANDVAEEGSVTAIIEELFTEEKAGGIVYLGGHRPVMGNYALRQNGKFIQIHNPSKQNISILMSNKKFNPETDIVEVGDE